MGAGLVTAPQDLEENISENETLQEEQEGNIEESEKEKGGFIGWIRSIRQRIFNFFKNLFF